MKILIIDNYDSFSYNVVQSIRSFGAQTTVLANDKTTVEDALSLEPSHLVISPGPGKPHSAGVSEQIVRGATGNIPI